MQIKIPIIVTVVIALIAVLVGPSFIERTKPRAAHVGFLEKITEGNYEHAFDFIAYHTGNPEVEPDLPYEEARDIWVNRLEEFKAEGYIFSSYFDENVWWEGDEPYGKALLTIRKGEFGEEFEVFFNFVKRDKWLISELYVIEEGQDEEFEYVNEVLTPDLTKK